VLSEETEVMEMKVVGIDVGPGKGAHICDGKTVFTRSPQELRDYLDGLPENVLIAWDAPLTGPTDPDDEKLAECDLTKRLIEKFFSTQDGEKTPDGISIGNYSNCSHWTITRRFLGLPRVGPYDAKDLPFTLVETDAHKPKLGRYVVEVHPAVALWLWCKSDEHTIWRYKNKKDSACMQALIKTLNRKINIQITADNDDELDAWIAWYLADQWLNGNGVMLLGDARTGSFLVPDELVLRRSFANLVGKRTFERGSGMNDKSCQHLVLE
jgi:hypothetical protein